MARPNPARGNGGDGCRPGCACAARCPRQGPNDARTSTRPRRRIRLPPGSVSSTVVWYRADDLRAQGRPTSTCTDRWPAAACGRPGRRPPVCVTVTLVDGLVLARSVFNHSVNYRCAMVYGPARLVDDPAEKLAGLQRSASTSCPASGATPRPVAQGAAADDRPPPRPRRGLGEGERRTAGRRGRGPRTRRLGGRCRADRPSRPVAAPAWPTAPCCPGTSPRAARSRDGAGARRQLIGGTASDGWRRARTVPLRR